jgi:hypothetical protein
MKKIIKNIISVKQKIIQLLNLLKSCIMLLPWFFLLGSIVYLVIRLANLSYKTTCDQDQKIITLYKTRLVENDINFIEKICIEKTGRKQSVDCWEEQLAILNGAAIKKQTKNIIMD